LLAASTDGVGTKLILARRRGRLRACGADLAAHCINDVATCGAEPLVLLDYVAANEIRLDEVAELVEGAAEVCRAAGVALIGGETAELPGIYAEGELDFAGTCVGTVARGDVIDGSTIEPGDTVIGFPSAGVHANGFTLVRRILDEEDYDGDDLLAPTRLYLDTARVLRGRAKAFAHITGGGILGNLARVVPDARSAEIDWSAWQRPPVSRYSTMCHIWSSGRFKKRVKMTIRSAVLSASSPGTSFTVGLIVPSLSSVKSTVHLKPCRVARSFASCGIVSSERYS